MLTLPGHSGQVLSAGFSPDGTAIRTLGRTGMDAEGQKSIRILIYDTRPASQTFRRVLEAPPPRAKLSPGP